MPVSPASLSTVSQTPLGTGAGQTGRIPSQLQGSYYPSPFFDIANTYLPSNIKSLFRFCAYYYATNPVVGNAIYRMASFPVTDLIINTTDEGLKDTWKEILDETLDIKNTLIEAGINFQAFGNVFMSLHLPIRRYLKCSRCDKTHRIEDIAYEYRQYEFRGTCKGCDTAGKFSIVDEPLKQKNRIGIVFWDPNNIDIEFNQVTGERIYRYSIPNNLRRVIITGKPRRILNTIPTYFIDAVKQKKQVIFKPDQIFHMRRPTLAGRDMGWGHPVLMNVLKHLFVTQLFTKAREVIAFTYILPLWVLYPQSYNNENPYELINMDRWQERVTAEILKWRQDPGYMPIMPLPLGSQFIGGQGAQMSLVPEIENLMADVIAGLLVPREFVYGGLSFSGTSITIRMLENQFANFRKRSLRFVHWIQKQIAAYFELKTVDLSFSDLRMADDIQRKQLAANLAAQRRLPWAKIHEDWGETSEEINKIIDKEVKRDFEMQIDLAKAQAKAQGEALLVQSKYQYKAQILQQQMIAEAQQDLISQGIAPEQVQTATDNIQAQGGFELPTDTMKQLYGQAEQEVAGGDTETPANFDNNMIDPRQIVEQWAQQLVQLSEAERSKMLEQLSQGNALQAMVAQRAIELLTNTDMRPQPEQLPPRRRTPSV